MNGSTGRERARLERSGVRTTRAVSPPSGRIVLTVLALLSTIALSCAGPRRPNVRHVDVTGWHELQSPDFVLYSRGSVEDLEAFARDLSRFVAVVQRLVQSEPPKTRAQIFLVDDRAEQLYVPEFSIRGFTFSTLAGFDGVVRSSRHDPVNRSVFLHEYTHYLNLRSLKISYPAWYVEGFAEFLGSMRTRGDTIEIGSAPPWRLKELDRRRSAHREIDLRRIFSFEKKVGARLPDEFYSISWATVHYLNSSPEGRKQLVSMVDLQSRGIDWKRAYAASFAEPIAELSDEVDREARFMSEGTPGAILYLPLESLEVRDQFEIREIPPAEAARLLADLALREGTALGEEDSLRLAEAMFMRALELDPDDVRARSGLASALAERQEFDAADRQIALFERDADPPAEALVHAANAIQRHALALDGDEDRDEAGRLHEAAMKLYRRAIQMQPGNPFARAGLGRSQLTTGDLDAARASLAEAQGLGEWDAQLTLDRGRVEAQAMAFDRARAFWQEVIRLGWETDAAEAIRLLESIENR